MPKRARARCSEPSQSRVERLVQRLDALESLGDGQASPVDVLAIGHDSRNGAEARRDAHRAGVGETGNRPVDQARVELIGFAIDVEIGARITGMDERNPAFGRGLEEEIDESVFRAAQLERREARGAQEGFGIKSAGMGR